jgi:hypothetical protein
MGPLALEQRWFGQAKFAALHRPLAHLPAAPPEIPRLRIDCIDAGDGVALGLSPFRKRHVGAGNSIGALGPTGLRVLWDEDSRFVQALDLATGRGFFYVENFDRLPEWEPTIPFRSFIHWAAAAAGHVLLHAGSIGTAEGGILLLGRGGAGKSTTTLAAIDAGLQSCGDDYVLVTLGRNPEIHSVYGTAKLKDGGMRPGIAAGRIAATAARVANKTILFPATELPGSFRASFPLCGLAVLSRTDGLQSTVSSTNAMAAVKAAAPSTVLQMAFDQNASLGAIVALARQRRCIDIRLGRDLAVLGRVLKDLIADLAARRDAA